jgi:hypothetical protein
MLTIAALYVDPRGPYPRMEGVDCWDESRDATKYPGAWPVVAHPPCGPWGRLKNLCHGHGIELGPIAVAQVRAYGGVLEHPSDSRLFRHCKLPFPGELPDAWGGYTVSCNQADWGHVARKPTWLYLVGVSNRELEYPAPGAPTHCIGGGKWRGSKGGRRLLVCSAQQRRRTPLAFAEYLVRLARAAGEARRAA